jgi:hypothetical protein
MFQNIQNINQVEGSRDISEYQVTEAALPNPENRNVPESPASSPSMFPKS